MTTQDIEKYEKIASKINNFRQCYIECELHGDVNGDVNAGIVLEWLIANLHLSDLAIEISRDYKNLK